MEQLTIEVSTYNRIVSTSYRDIEQARDVIDADSFKFQGGRIYGVIRESGSGGWGINFLI